MELVREDCEKYKLTDSNAVYEFLREFKDQDREMFIVIGLNTKNKVLYREVVGIGTLDSCILHPREVFKMAFIKSAQKVIIAHNHPSGDAEPSEEDKEIFSKLKEVGKIIDIKVLDNFVIGNGEYYSEVEGVKKIL